MTDIHHIRSTPRSSAIVIHSGIIYLTGQVATNRDGAIRAQTAETLEKIDALLAEAGSDKWRILAAQIWLKDIARDFAAMNEVWDAWTSSGAAPARATCQCEMAAPDVLIEIIVTAAVAP